MVSWGSSALRKPLGPSQMANDQSVVKEPPSLRSESKANLTTNDRSYSQQLRQLGGSDLKAIIIKVSEKREEK